MGISRQFSRGDGNTRPLSQESASRTPRDSRSAAWVAPKISPLNGLVALVLVFAGIALANSTLAIQHALVPGPSWADTGVAMALGSLGVICVWRGLRAGDAAGSLLGYAGGSLIWMGYFEWTWLSFSVWLGVDTLVIDGVPVLPPTLLLVQASSLIFLPLAMLVAANRDTRCRMMLWLRKRLHLKIQVTSTTSRHQAARVTATETLFIIWFVYLLTIAVYDPRILGRGDAVGITAMTLLAAWGIFLLGRLVKQRTAGAAIRYAIPTAYILSIPVDSLAMRGFYPAFWVKPLEYPMAAAAAVTVFAAAAVVLTRSPRTTSKAAGDHTVVHRARRILEVGPAGLSGGNAGVTQ